MYGVPRRPSRQRVWPSVLLLLVLILGGFSCAAHRDYQRQECVERGGVPSDALGYGVRCTEVQP